MRIVTVNQDHLEYDIHSIVKAFYPGETVKVLAKEGTQYEETGTVSLHNTAEREDALQQEESRECRMDIRLEKQSAELRTDGKQFSCEMPCGDEKERKQALKRFLYVSLSELTGKKLPWGNLTGIRPTKIAMVMLEEGRTKQQIRNVFEQEHYVSPEKTELAIEIAERERRILSGIHYRDGYSLYIGIPFCPTTCLYCSFTSYPICRFEKETDRYVDCLIEEMRETAELMKGKILDTVYIGGGTPTTLTALQLQRLICALKDIFPFETVTEFTVEAGRADSITKEKLCVLQECGVSRVSVNPQTMHDETLVRIGRRHTVAQAEQAFLLARECGFSNINMDIILGLPGETQQHVGQTIERIAALSPDSLTVHSLAVKRASKLRQIIREQGIDILPDTEDAMRIASEGAAKMGMRPYYLYRQKNMSGNLENVGFAREGKEGIYNILIMEEKQTIIACGAGSITKRVFPDGRIERCDNVKDVELYMDRIKEMIERKRRLFED